ncbi:MAG: hypothetical protein ACPHUL_00035 [Marinomonas gallaica]
MSFAKQLTYAVETQAGDLDRVWKRSVVGAFTQYVLTTPVGNPDLWKSPAPPGYVGGAARGSYVISERPTEASPDGSTSPTRVTMQKIPEVGGSVTIYSTLPYMARLDDGYSKQAPAGMSSIVTANWPSIVKRSGG